MDYQKNLPPFSKLDYSPNPQFGAVHIPLILWFDIKVGESTPKKVYIEPLKDVSLSPFCSTLHYGQSIFEGMKAYRQSPSQVGIFRPEFHAKRFSKSAETMGMIKFSPELFLECLVSYMKACKEYVPEESGHSLYLRPLLMANDPVIKLKSSESYRFMIMSSIAGSYFSQNAKGQRAIINKDFIRAFPGGTGEAKTAANYALSLNALEYAYSKSFDQVLYVDALKKEKIEEFGGMNFFMVKDGEILTPKLDGQILKGVTRQSIIEMANSLNMKCREETILLSDLISGNVSEVFASGTASSITPIAELGFQETMGAPLKIYKFEKSEFGDQLREYLTKTQAGKTEHSSDWLYPV